jgi:hypothetical protein
MLIGGNWLIVKVFLMYTHIEGLYSLYLDDSDVTYLMSLWAGKVDYTHLDDIGYTQGEMLG